MGSDGAGLAWQMGVRDRMSQIYRDEIDPRFEPVVDSLLRRADLRPGERVLDFGAGTGAAASRAASTVGDDGRVLAVDISPDMVALARQRSAAGGAPFEVEASGADRIPAEWPEGAPAS